MVKDTAGFFSLRLRKAILKRRPQVIVKEMIVNPNKTELDLVEKAWPKNPHKNSNEKKINRIKNNFLKGLAKLKTGRFDHLTA